MKLVLAFSFVIFCSTFWFGCSNNALVLREGTGVQTEANNSVTTTATPIKAQREDSTNATPTPHQNIQTEETSVAIRFLSGWQCALGNDSVYEFVITAENMLMEELNDVYLTVILYSDDGTEVNRVTSIVIPSLPGGASFTVEGTLDAFGFEIDLCEASVTDKSGLLLVES